MKSKLSRGGVLILATLFLLIPNFVLGKALINEIFPNPIGSDKDKEFIEIFNNKEENLSLKNWVIRKISKKGIVKKYKFKEDDLIKAKDYFIIHTDSLNNDGATIELFDEQKKLVDKKEYGVSHEGQSYNRDENKNNEKWYWTEPTRREKNGKNPASEKYPEIKLNELYPNPADTAETDEFIELYNPNDKNVDLNNWQLRDASKTGVFTFRDKTIIEPGKFLVIYRQDFKFALNNSGEEIVYLIAPNGKTSNSLKYKDSRKNFSYNYNQTTKEWSWSKIITPGARNKFNHIPTFIINVPKEVIAGVENKFEINNLQDKDGDEVKTYWDFGDKNKMEGEDILHTYLKPGKYSIKIIIDDGTEEVFKTIDIKVVSPPLANLTLVKLLPNPEGTDSGKEKISIKNIGKIEVNLKDYKIATGSNRDRIVKHNILQTLNIKPGEEIEINNKEVCKFILTNQKGVVQLIMPDGRIIDEVQYEKDDMLPTQEYFLGKDGQWHWSVVDLFPANHLPTFKIKYSKKVYKNVYAEFKIKNLKDKDGDKMKVSWDFGDGHKSYLKKTKHKFKKTGKYEVILRVKDGKEEVVKKINIKVKKYPKHKLQIISLMPNPDGKDKGREFVILKNNDNKKINLADYKIATGRNTKHLIKHPFYKEIIIKPGEVRKIFNKTISKFSLLNSRGVVQLIYPNGKVADKVIYSKKKVLPNEQYVLNKDKWQWQRNSQDDLITVNDSRGTQVLGNRISKKYIDITLNTRVKICETTQQIKITNWRAKNNKNKLKKSLLYFELDKYLKNI